MVVPASRVLQILDGAARAGVEVWLDGGWGVDALLGDEHREHDDVDLVVPLIALPMLISALRPHGFRVIDDLLPTRLVLGTIEGERIDVHSVTFDDTGVGWQVAAAPDGADCRYPASCFVTGTVAGQVVPCLDAATQMDHHSGYAPRPHDIVDVQRLATHFALPVPPNYC